MVDFDLILGIVWIFPHHVVLDCHYKTVTLAMPDCVRDVSREGLTIYSVPTVQEFADVFPADLPGLPPDCYIDFAIDVELGTHPISIPPYPYVGAYSSLLDHIRSCQFEDEEIVALLDQVLREFAYNNNYHSSVQMAPFEALYGRRYRSSVGWFEFMEPRLRGTDLMEVAFDHVRVIQDSLKIAQSRHKIYTNHRRRPLWFVVGDKVFLRVSPIKGMMRFGRQGKLILRYIRPFEIWRKVGEVLYELAFPLSFSTIDLGFYVLMLCRYAPDESHMFQYDAVDLDDCLGYIEELFAILARDVRQLRSISIPVVKVHWTHRLVEEATWETNHKMQAHFLALFRLQVLIDSYFRR
ncbi:uncharacterized protein LOC129892885 [Solanum dulcamara]|uniref:uncharacterized protein LOC129892885 n=1 Tax=Solanum dulcamara TaxID=45834 RepID=UPI002486C582|nr:uncharacterized protein LOC129892885 [Solanum dulcamara]